MAAGRAGSDAAATCFRANRVVRRGLLDPDAVERTIREHEQQRADRTDHLLALINLEIWCRLYLDGQSAAGVADHLKQALAA